MSFTIKSLVNKIKITDQSLPDSVPVHFKEILVARPFWRCGASPWGLHFHCRVCVYTRNLPPTLNALWQEESGTPAFILCNSCSAPTFSPSSSLTVSLSYSLFCVILYSHVCSCYIYYGLDSAYEGEHEVFFFLRLYDIYSKSIHFPASFVTSFFRAE